MNKLQISVFCNLRLWISQPAPIFKMGEGEREQREFCLGFFSRHGRVEPGGLELL